MRDVDPNIREAQEKYPHAYGLTFSVEYENDSYIDDERMENEDIDTDNFSYAYDELLKALENNFNRYKKELSEIFGTSDIEIKSEDASYGYYLRYPNDQADINIYYNNDKLPYKETTSKLKDFVNEHPDLLDIYGDYNDSYTDGYLDGGSYYDSSLGGYLPSEKTFTADINIGAYIESFDFAEEIY